MKISCAIVDDNIESVEILKSHVAKVPLFEFNRWLYECS